MRKRVSQFDPIDPVDDAEPADFGQRTWEPEQLMNVTVGRKAPPGPPVHWVAALFPMMSNEDLDALAADIKANGLIHPILRDADGQIIDGRNRLEACRRANVEPRYEQLNSSDAMARIALENVRRRHMLKSQTAIVAAHASLDSKLSVGDMAKLFGLSETLLVQANIVVKHAPDLADGVLDGTERLDRAYDVARQRKLALQGDAERRQRQEAELADLRAEAPDLADLVRDKDLTLSEAQDRLRKRQDDDRRERVSLSQTVIAALQTFDGNPHIPLAERVQHLRRVSPELVGYPVELSAEWVRRVIALLELWAQQLELEGKGHG